MSESQQRRGPGTLAGVARGGERRPGMRAIGDAVPRLVGPIVAKQGGGVLARLKLEWPAIVGPELAAATWPAAFGPDGVLKLHVGGAAALELQHRAPLVIERINLYFGRPAVQRLVLLQRPLPAAPRTASPESLIAPTAAEAADLTRQVAPIEDAELREALARLGCAILGKRGI